MTRLYAPGSAPIRVVTDQFGRPKAFTWMGETQRVASIEEVREPRLEWWAVTGEVHRTYFLVVTVDGMICEVYRDELAAAEVATSAAASDADSEGQAAGGGVPGGMWGLARVWD